MALDCGEKKKKLFKERRIHLNLGRKTIDPDSIFREKLGDR